MYRFFKKNNKKLLAVFAAFLMIVFILPTTNIGSAPNPVIGEMGDFEIRDSDIAQAKAEWGLLRRAQVPMGQFGMTMTLPELVLGLGAHEIQDHPELFVLLRREAEEMGIAVDQDRLNELHVNVSQNIMLEPGQTELLRSALHHLLLVQGAFSRVADVVKVSEPMLRRDVAREGQEIKVRLVEFPAGESVDETLNPSETSLKTHFETYADIDPNALPPEHEGFAFGYKEPGRIKLQYIAIPREELKKVVQASKDDYQWEVAAYKHYTRNPQNYPSTRPAATQPTTQEAAAGPANESAGPPTTRPFEEVKTDIRDSLVNQETEKLAKEIEAKVQSILAADWLSYRNATGGATTMPAQAPISSLGVPYNSFEYLERLAQHIQKQHGVLPTVVSIAEPKWSKELAALPGIGGAFSNAGDFATYATTRAEPLLSENEQPAGDVLSLYEPSQPLRNFAEGTVYFFRLNEAQKPRRPESLEQVRSKVLEDYRIAEGFTTALAKAKELAQAAEPARLATVADGRTVVTTGFFSNAPWAMIEGYNLSSSPSAQRDFIDAAFELLSIASESDEHPVTVVELPQVGKVLVLELEEVRQRYDAAVAANNEAAVRMRLLGEHQSTLQQKWFTFEEAAKRTGYRSLGGPPVDPAAEEPPAGRSRSLF